MAFQQKEWKNRLSENPTRRLLTPVDGSTPFEVDVTRAEGTILQQGDPFNADNMNDLEQRIADGIGGGDVNMAPIEEGPESASAYTVGQLLIYNGQLYRVTDAIAIGNSLVEGVNIEATTVSNELVGEMTANGNRLYMDYKDGKYGYNTSPSRGADTFVPFKSGYTIPYLWAQSDGDARNCEANYLFDVTDYNYFKIASATSNYGLGSFSIEKDSVRIGGTELINTEINVQNASQIRVKAIGNTGSSFTNVTMTNIQIYN